MSFLQTIGALLCGYSIGWYFGVECCQKIEKLGASANRVRIFSSQAALIKVALPSGVTSLLDMTTDDALQSLVIVTYPPLEQGVDFELFSYSRENGLPVEYRTTKRQFVGLRLLPGKQWIKDIYTASTPKPLFVADIFVCKGTTGTKPPFNQDNSTWVQIASIVHKKAPCPKIPNLPGASKGLQSLVDVTLRECQMPRVVKSARLDWRKVNSFALLSLQPRVLLVDGTDQSLAAASSAVDTFLAAHGVLAIAWEPYTESEPRWWILVPRPAGMPGHLFAMIDTMQWNHPFVAEAVKYRAMPMCNTSVSGCVPGCPKTKIKGITGSGWGADTGHVVQAFQRFFVDFEPMQAGPFRLGYRYTPPLWGGTIGWLYTYKGCSSNFLDCYFLEHSPCPQINMDTSIDPGKAIVDKKRFESSKPQNHGWSSKPAWWEKVMGPQSTGAPENTIRDLHGIPANHVMYSYFFRPKYDLRKIIHERMVKFKLESPSAVMHVRRGDSIMHTGQARAYLKIKNYIEASRALMDAMGIKTIFLVTDSQGAIDEAMSCAKEFPAICGGITFRFLDKKRWVGAEGGWENPFPSGDSRTELLDIQLEFALATKCTMAITGDSNYASKIIEHMCCGFPLSSRGELPHRCHCPPYVKLEQHGFDCRRGNQIHCVDPTGVLKGGDITRPLNDPTNMLAANLSLQSSAFMSSTRVCHNTIHFTECYDQKDDSSKIKRIEAEFIKRALVAACVKYSRDDESRPAFCN